MTGSIGRVDEIIEGIRQTVHAVDGVGCRLIGPDLNILAVNQVLADQLDVPADRQIGASATLGIMASDHDAFIDHIRQTLLFGHATAVNVHLTSPSDPEIPVSISSVRLFDADRGALCMSTIQEPAGRVAGADCGPHAKYRALFDQTPDSVFVLCAADGAAPTLQTANPAAHATVIGPDKPVRGTPISSFMPVPTWRYLTRQMNRVIRRGRTTRQTMTLSFNRDSFPAEVTMVPIDTRDVLCIVRDISDTIEPRTNLEHSRDLLASIFDSSDVGIAITDINLHLVAVNHAYATFYRTTPEALRGRSVLDLVPEKQHRDIKEWHQRVLQGEIIRQEEVTVPGGQHDDAGPRALSIVSSRLRTRSGPDYTVAMLTDITRQKQLERALRSRQEELARIADHLPALIAQVDPDESVTFANKTFSDWFGIPRERIIGLKVRQLLPSEAYERIRGGIDRALTGETITILDAGLFPDGERRHVRLNLMPRFVEDSEGDTNGELTDGAYVFGFDITDAIQSQQQLRNAKEKAETANKAKSQFLANMSHELRTPLNAIIGFSDIISNELFGPLGHANYRDYTRDILTSAQHLLSLINDVLDLSKIEAGRFELFEEPLNLLALIEDVMAIVRLKAHKNGLTIEQRVDPSCHWLMADSKALRQMLLNLLTNAQKFTPSGGHIQLAVWSNDKNVCFSVIDSGIGIPESKLHTVFEPFAQIDNVLTRTHEGTGIGLSITRAFAALHGGNIDVTSMLGHGSTFTIKLPIWRALPESWRQTPDKQPASPDSSG